jgi:hypothetical protein
MARSRYMRVDSTSTRAKPACVSLSRYLLSSSAPAMDSTQSSMLRRTGSGTESPLMTMSDTPRRPPGGLAEGSSSTCVYTFSVVSKSIRQRNGELGAHRLDRSTAVGDRVVSALRNSLVVRPWTDRPLPPTTTKQDKSSTSRLLLRIGSLIFLHPNSGVRPECYNRGRAASCPHHHRRVADVQRLRRVELAAVGAMYW